MIRAPALPRCRRGGADRRVRAAQPARRDHSRARGVARRHRGLAGARAVAAAGRDEFRLQRRRHRRIPTDKPGVGYMVSSLLDEGAGELDAKAFQQRLEDNAVELRFSVTPRLFLRLAPPAEGPPGAELRPAAARAQPAALRRRRDRARARADPGRRCGARPPIPSSIASRTWWQHRVSRSSLRPPDQRHADIGSDDHRRRSAGLCARRCSTRDKLKIAVVGDIDAATLGQMLDRVFGALPANGDAAPRCRMRRCATAAGAS